MKIGCIIGLLIVLLTVLSCLLFRTFEIKRIEDCRLTIYNEGTVVYRGSWTANEKLEEWINFNENKLYHVCAVSYLPRAIVYINNEYKIVFHHHSVSVYDLNARFFTSYIRRMKERDYLFLEHLLKQKTK